MQIKWDGNQDALQLLPHLAHQIALKDLEHPHSPRQLKHFHLNAVD